MVQMMLVRLNSRAGLYSVFRLLSHSALVLPNSWCANEEAISVYTAVPQSALCLIQWWDVQNSLFARWAMQ